MPHAFSLIAYADLCGLRLVQSAHGEAAEIFHDERDALRANQAQVGARSVGFSQCFEMIL